MAQAKSHIINTIVYLLDRGSRCHVLLGEAL
jgi:hypothetical protein